MAVLHNRRGGRRMARLCSPDVLLGKFPELLAETVIGSRGGGRGGMEELKNPGVEASRAD